MNKIRVIIIDDGVYCVKDLQRKLLLFDNVEIVNVFYNAPDAIQFLGKDGRVDIIFLDIEMPEMSGIEAAPILEPYCDLLVMTTGHLEYREQVSEMVLVPYLTKPVEQQKLEDVIKKLVDLRANANQINDGFDKIFVREWDTKVDILVDLDDIYSVSSARNYVIYNTSKGLMFEYGSLKRVEERLCGSGRFIRVSQSFIIGKKKIGSIEGNRVKLTDDSVVVVTGEFGKRFRNDFYKKKRI